MPRAKGKDRVKAGAAASAAKNGVRNVRSSKTDEVRAALAAAEEAAAEARRAVEEAKAAAAAAAADYTRAREEKEAAEHKVGAALGTIAQGAMPDGTVNLGVGAPPPAGAPSGSSAPASDAPALPSPASAAGAAPSYGASDYWEARYAAEAGTGADKDGAASADAAGTEPGAVAGTTFDWYLEYDKLGPIIRAALPVAGDPPVLIVGCGNSTLSEDMHGNGYTHVTSIDISKSAVESMRGRASAQGRSLLYLEMDAASMTFPSHSFAGAIDKGTLDAVISGGAADGLTTAMAILREVSRVLVPGGRFLLVSSIEPGLYKALLASVFTVDGIDKVSTGYGAASASADFAEAAYVYRLTTGGSVDSARTSSATNVAGAGSAVAASADAVAAARVASDASVDDRDAEPDPEMERLLASINEAVKEAEGARDTAREAGARVADAARDVAAARSDAAAAEHVKAEHGRSVDDAAVAMRSELEVAEAQLAQQAHLERNLAEYARSKGVEHAEVEVLGDAAAGEAPVKWSWAQTKSDLTVTVPVPAGTSVTQVRCRIKRGHIVAGLKGADPIIDADLFDNIVKSDSSWALVDKKALSIELRKDTVGKFWPQLLAGAAGVSTGAVPASGTRDYSRVARGLKAVSRASSSSSSASTGAGVASGDVAPSSSRGEAPLPLKVSLTVTSSVQTQARGRWDIAFSVERVGPPGAGTEDDPVLPSDRDYIGLYKVGETRADEYEDLEYTDGESVGSLSVTAPSRGGVFDVAYVIGEGRFAGKMVARSSRLTALSGDDSSSGGGGGSGRASDGPASTSAGAAAAASRNRATPAHSASRPKTLAAATRPAFLVERQCNISAYQVYVSRPSSAGWMPRVSGKGRAVVIRLERGGAAPEARELRLLLTDDVELGKCHITEHGDHYAVRIPFAYPGSGMRDRQDSLVTGWELEMLRGAELGCRFCGAAIVPKGALPKTFQLPSGYWMELSDYWVCHPDESNEALRKGELTAQPTKCLVGEAHVLVHAANVVEGALELSEIGEEAAEAVRAAVASSEEGRAADGVSGTAASFDTGERAIRMVECARCGHPVGTADVSHDATFPAVLSGDTMELHAAKADDVTLWKDRVAAMSTVPLDDGDGGDDNDEVTNAVADATLVVASDAARVPRAMSPYNVLAQYTVVSRLCTEMMDACTAHGHFHFIVSAADCDVSPLADGAVRMLLSLSSWDTSIDAAGTDGLPVNVRGAQMRAVLKVRYRHFGAGPNGEDLEEIGEWRAVKAPQPFLMLDDECTSVQEMLDVSSRLFPASLQADIGKTGMFAWPMAFLFLAGEAPRDGDGDGDGHADDDGGDGGGGGGGGDAGGGDGGAAGTV